MKYIAQRLAEPSTYAAFAAIAVGLGVSAPLYTAAAGAAAGIFGLVAFLLPETSK